MSAAPRPHCDASTCMVTGLELSKYCREFGDASSPLICWTADSCLGPHWKSLLFFVRFHRVADTEARLGMKRLRNCVMPRKVCKSARHVDGSMLAVASTFRGSSLRLLALMIRPKNGSSVHLILHLSALNRRPVLRARDMTACRFLS